MSLGNESGLSASDVALLSGNNNNGGNGFFGGEWLIALIIIFMFPMMFGRNGLLGNGGNNGGGDSVGTQLLPYAIGGNGALTRSDLCSEFNFNGLESSIRGVQQGICDSTFALNNTITNGFHGVDNAICNLGFTTQQGFNATQVAMMQGQNALQTQLADCCCKNQTGQMQIGNQIQAGFCDSNYNLATNTNAIIQNAHTDTDRVIAKLDAMEMARKDETIADLRTQLAQCGDRATADSIVARLSTVINPPPVPAYPAASPCGLGNWAPQVLNNGWGNTCNSCGCGC